MSYVAFVEPPHEPQPWQYATESDKTGFLGRRLSRCSVAVDLCLEGGTLQNDFPDLEDLNPMSSWHVLCVEACQDDKPWTHFVGHDDKVFLSGPEVFLHVINQCLGVMQRRLWDLIHNTSYLAQPPVIKHVAYIISRESQSSANVKASGRHTI